MKNSSHYTLAFFNREFGRRDVAQSGSAPQWGCGGRWFESSRPDHRSPKTLEADEKGIALTEVREEQRRYWQRKSSPGEWTHVGAVDGNYDWQQKQAVGQ